MADMYDSIHEILEEFGIALVYGCGWYKGLRVRWLPGRSAFQVGVEDFDRWANSVDLEFDMKSKKGLREFRRWARTTRGSL